MELESDINRTVSSELESSKAEKSNNNDTADNSMRNFAYSVNTACRYSYQDTAHQFLQCCRPLHILCGQSALGGNGVEGRPIRSFACLSAYDDCDCI